MDIEFMGIEPNILLNKRRHIEICLDPSSVESSRSTYFEDIYLKHYALSELNFSEIDTKVRLFDYEIGMPVFISSMTGGSKEGNELNKALVRIANQIKIPIGLGSFKLFFKYPEYIKDFKLKGLASSIPLFSNIGAVQIKEFGVEKVMEMSKILEVDAQIIHLNSGQELMNPDGDRNFSEIKKSISEFCKKSRLPVIVKETGFGLSPLDVKELIDLGASYVDLAGSGGTNWVLVEGIKEQREQISSSFSSWGIPSVLTLLSLDSYVKNNVFASGGFKSGLDIVKGLSLGAKMIGVAAHCLRIFCNEGEDAVFKLFDDYNYVLKMAMLMTESKNLSEFQKNKYILSGKLINDLIYFKEAYGTK